MTNYNPISPSSYQKYAWQIEKGSQTFGKIKIKPYLCIRFTKSTVGGIAQLVRASDS